MTKKSQLHGSIDCVDRAYESKDDDNETDSAQETLAWFDKCEGIGCNPSCSESSQASSI